MAKTAHARLNGATKCCTRSDQQRNRTKVRSTTPNTQTDRNTPGNRYATLWADFLGFIPERRNTHIR